jgi:hypothetical protein
MGRILLLFHWTVRLGCEVSPFHHQSAIKGGARLIRWLEDLAVQQRRRCTVRRRLNPSNLLL